MVPNTVKYEFPNRGLVKFPLHSFLSRQPPHLRTHYGSRARTSYGSGVSSNHDVCIRYAQCARDYLNENESSSRSIYRSLLLKNNVILQSSLTLDWMADALFEYLALMGQEVDGAIFDLRNNCHLRREFFKPQLAPAYEALVQVLRILLPALPQSSLVRYTFVQLLTHWLFVCHLHLVRGWLLCQPRRRGLVDAHNDVVPLSELIIQRYHLNLFVKALIGRLDEYSENELSEVRQLQTPGGCSPRRARKLYSLIYILLQGGRKQTIRVMLNNSNILNLVVLIEAEWSWARRVINRLSEVVYTATGRTLTSKKLFPSDIISSSCANQIQNSTSIYEKPLEFASATAGILSIICVLMFLLLLVRLTLKTRVESLGFQLIVHTSDTPLGDIRRVLVCYCCLAPVCVYLSLVLRLWFTNLILCRSDLIDWFLNWNNFGVPEEFVGLDALYSTHLHRLQFEIYWTWKMVVHYEQRLRVVSEHLAHHLAHWNMPVPLEYLWPCDVI